MVLNTIHGIQNEGTGWTEYVCAKCDTNDGTSFQIDDM